MTNKSEHFDRLAVLVASGQPVSTSADACNVSRSRAYQTSRTPEFKAEVSKLRAEYLAEATGRLAASATRAVEALETLVVSSDDDGVKLRAANSILDRFSKLTETLELAQRIEAIEQQLKTEVESDEP